MLHRILLGLFFSLGLLAQESTFVLLRHGEKTSRLDCAGLSTKGQRRAVALAEELHAMGPAALFSTEFTRTQQTLEPLARRLSLPVQVRIRGEEQALAEELLREYRGRIVVVCSHSDRLARLLEALGHPTDLVEVREFDRLWILRVGPDGSIRLEERRQKPLAP